MAREDKALALDAKHNKNQKERQNGEDLAQSVCKNTLSAARIISTLIRK